MKVVLVGYMGSGKTMVGNLLAEQLKIPFRDLDSEIEQTEGMSIADVFDKKGEIYFRKKENQVLKDILTETGSYILATGGGTPCYGDSLSTILGSPSTKTVYLKASIGVLTERLFLDKEERPLVAHLEDREKMMEFIGIHLFERSHFYNQADIILDVRTDSPQILTTRIIQELF